MSTLKFYEFAVPGCDVREFETLLAESFAEDPLVTTKIVFNIRDVLSGGGRRDLFDMAMTWYAENAIDWLVSNADLVIDYGRWDDYFRGVWMQNDRLRDYVINKCITQLRADIDAKFDNEVSLLAKWIPREGKALDRSSRKDGRGIVLSIANTMFPVAGGNIGTCYKMYRQTISELNARLDTVERRLCEKDYTGINFDKVTNSAMRKYYSVFQRETPVAFAEWKRNCTVGEVAERIIGVENISTHARYDAVSAPVVEAKKENKRGWLSLIW